MSFSGPKVCGVYEIRHVASGRRYIGSSVDVRQRWCAHLSRLKVGKHHSKRLQRAWSKYGQSAFEHRVLLMCAPENLHLYEKIAIDAYDTYWSGFNGCPVPYSSLGRRQTEETKQKLSAIGKANKRPPEAWAAMRAANAGRHHSPETIEKMRRAKAGRVMGPLSEEHRIKLSVALTGMKRTPEQVEKIRAHRHTEESKRKVSASKTGKKLKPRDPEHTRRQQESLRRTLEARRKGEAK